MTTSGTYAWTQTRDGIITRALKIMGKLNSGGTASANQLTEGAVILNAMVKEWSNRGVLLWESQWIQHTVTMSSEVIGSDSLNYTCILAHTAATTTRPVTGLNHSTFWTERGSSGVVHTLGSTYSSAGDFEATDIIAIERAFIRKSGIDTPLQIIDKAAFFDLPDKAEFGTPSMVWLDVKTPCRIYLRPIPIDVNEVIHLDAIKRLQDFSAGTDNPDMPTGWINALTWGLADEWGYEMELDKGKQDRIGLKAREKFSSAISGTQQSVGGSYFMSPRYR